MDKTGNTENETSNREIEVGDEVADVFNPIFMRTSEQILELGLRQMREENESLSTENRRLKDEIRTLIEQARRAGFVGATKDKHP
jgi:hypothetical protein